MHLVTKEQRPRISALGRCVRIKPGQTSLESEDLLGRVDAPHRSIGTDGDLSQEPRDLVPALSLRIESEDLLSRIDPPDHTIIGHRYLRQLPRDLIPTWCL